ncbi:MAG TPA: metal-dependent transcriptional regulator [Spirochaetia bacterium]
MESPVVENYLKKIYALQAGEKPLGTTVLGRELRVSPPSADQMVKRMIHQGFVTRARDRGIRLTPVGKRAALRLIRKYRIAECMLVGLLGLDWKTAYEEACKSEHVLSDEVEARISAVLHDPRTCPHGHPIPDRDGVVEEDEAVPLGAMHEGAGVVIVRVREEKSDLLEHLDAMGMAPGRTLEVDQIAPFGDSMLVRIDGAAFALGREITENVWVRDRSMATVSPTGYRSEPERLRHS